MDDRFWNNTIGINESPGRRRLLWPLSHHTVSYPRSSFSLSHSSATTHWDSLLRLNVSLLNQIVLRGGTCHLPFITPSYLHKLASLDKKHGNGPKKATYLDWSYKEVKGTLGSMENGGIGLRRGTRIVPTSTTCVHRANHPNGHLERRHPQKICYGAERLYYLSRGGSGIKA